MLCTYKSSANKCESLKKYVNLPWGMCMTATVKPALASYARSDFQLYLGSQDKIGSNEKIHCTGVHFVLQHFFQILRNKSDLEDSEKIP